MFEIQPMDPATFRQQTRRSTMIIAVLFLVLAMALSTAAVALFGEPAAIICVSMSAECSSRFC
jgi:hypothetical protein